jgi:Zn-dependent peptidase ImmA (M78 family)
MMHELTKAENDALSLRRVLISGTMSTAKVLPAFRRFVSERGWTVEKVDYDECDPNIESWIDPTTKIVYVRTDVIEAARIGNGRSCFTLIEEMFHIYYGHKHVRHRKSEYSASERAHDGINSDEKQAKMSAAAFLMPREEILDGASAQDVANKFGVSLSAADRRLSDLIQQGGFVREKREIPPSVADFVAIARQKAEALRQNR